MVKQVKCKVRSKSNRKKLTDAVLRIVSMSNTPNTVNILGGTKNAKP